VQEAGSSRRIKGFGKGIAACLQRLISERKSKEESKKVPV
jgi:hypothetical protein